MKKNYFIKKNPNLNLKQKLITSLMFLIMVLGTSSLKAQSCSVNANDLDLQYCVNDIMNLGVNGSTSSVDIVLWQQVSGPSVIILNPNSLTTQFIGAVPGTYVFQLDALCSSGNGERSLAQLVTVTVFDVTQANAGSNIEGCPAIYTLSANAPNLLAGESGTWAFVGGNPAGAVINDLGLSTSTVSFPATSSGVTIAQWTISNSITNPAPDNGLTDCSTSDTITLTNYGGELTVSAGGTQNLSECYTSTMGTTLTGSQGGTGLGGQASEWEFVSGPIVPIPFTGSPIPGQSVDVSGLTEGTYVFRYSVDGPCASGDDTVQIIVPPATQDISTVNAGPDQVFCIGSVTSTVLTGSTPSYAGETVEWVQTSGTLVVEASSLNSVFSITSTTTITFNDTNPVTFEYRVIGGPVNPLCTSSPDDVIISFATVTPTIDLDNGNDVVILPVNQTGNPTAISIPIIKTGGNAYLTEQLAGPVNGTHTTSGDNLRLSDLIEPGTYTFKVTRYSAGEIATDCNTASDFINVIVSLAPDGANAGTDTFFQCGITSGPLAGNIPTPGTGGTSLWSQISGPATGTIAVPTNNVTSVSDLTLPGEYVFRYSITGGPAGTDTFDDVTIYITLDNSSNAGTDRLRPTSDICPSNYITDAVPLLPGQMGTWTVDSADTFPSSSTLLPNPIFADVNNPVTTVTGLQSDANYVFRWTVKASITAPVNPNPCLPEFDDVIVQTNANSAPSFAVSGPDQCIASGTTTVTLGATTPVIGIGTWTLVSGPLTFIFAQDSSTDPLEIVTGLIPGAYEFLWTTTNGACQEYTDTVIITVQGAASVADAGNDQLLLCFDNIGATSVVMSASISPVTAIGTWVQTAGNGGWIATSGSYPNPLNDPNVTFSNLSEGVYEFEWEVAQGTCDADTDSVQFSVYYEAADPEAGPAQSICFDPSTPTIVNLGADFLPAGSTGTWSVVSGPNTPTVAAPTDPTSLITGLATGVYTFRWTSTGSGVCPPKSDDVTITITTPADAGPDRQYCNTSSFVLTGNDGTQGTWTSIGAVPLLITNGPNNSAIVTINPATTLVYGFRYEITFPAPISGCATTDTVLISNDALPTIPIAGTDQVICTGDMTSALMDANVIVSGSGYWAFPNDPGYTPPSVPAQMGSTDPLVTFTNLVEGLYIFEWVASNGACDNLRDVVRVEMFDPPINNGIFTPDGSTLCQLFSELEANAPSNGIGTWTLTGYPLTYNLGDLVIDNPNNRITSLTALNPNTLLLGTYTFDWTVSIGGSNFPGGACAPQVATVNINYDGVPPAPAVAGPDQTICNLTPASPYSITLNASTIYPADNGLWTLDSTTGSTPTISGPGSETTNVSGLTEGVYVFKWSVSNTGGGCTLDDSVQITITDAVANANAGPDQNLPETSPIIMAANDPIPGQGFWTFVSGPTTPSIIDMYNPNTQISGTVPGTYEFMWTVQNSPCAATTDNVIITLLPVVDLSLDKQVDNGTPFVGATVNYTVSVTNNETVNNGTGITVLDELPSGLTFVPGSVSNGGVYSSGTNSISWTGLSINAGVQLDLTYQAVVNATGSYVNSAEITAFNEYDPNSTPGNGSTNEDDDDVVTLVPIPIVDISLQKTVNNMTPYVGDIVVFTLTVSNDGPSNATGVEVTDVLPLGYTLVGTSASLGSVVGDPTIVWTVGALANGANETLQITATVNATGSYQNSAEATATNETDSDSIPNNGVGSNEDDDDSVTPVPIPVADLELTKTVDDTNPNAGDTVVFDITVLNNGPNTATDVDVFDYLPSGFAYDSHTFATTLNTSGSGAYDSVTGNWVIAFLEVGVANQVTLQLSAIVNPTGDYTNFAEIASVNEHDTDSTPGNIDITEDDRDFANVVVNQLPIAQDDESLLNIAGPVTITDITANNGNGVDSDPDGTIYVASINLIAPVGATAISIVGGDTVGFTVPGEGTWTLTALGAVTFTPQAGFTANPTPINYTIEDNDGDVSNEASITITYVIVPPVPTSNSSLANTPGAAVIVAVVGDDTDVDGSVDATQVSLVPTGTATSVVTNAEGNVTSFVEPGEGTWEVNPITGAITFTPESGFTEDPTPVDYNIEDNDGNESLTNATVTIDYVPVAVNDESLGNPVGTPVILNILTNDDLGDTVDPSTFVFGSTSVPLPGSAVLSGVAGMANYEVQIPGEGTWVYDGIASLTFTAEATFLGDPTDIGYTISDDDGNSAEALVNVEFDPPVIVALDDDFSTSTINSTTGGTTLSVLTNPTGIDTFNLLPVTVGPLNVVLTPGTAPTPVNGSISMNATTGIITVATNTTAGTYYYPYTICQIGDPTNCDSATATIVVVQAPIDANLDDFTSTNVNGLNGNATLGNVLTNATGVDTLNGAQATVGVSIGDVVISIVTPATPIAGAPVPVLDPLTGQISVPAGTPADDYQIEYSICEVLNPSNCDTDFVLVRVVPAPIVADDDSYILPLNSVNGLEGEAGVLNVYDNDTLNGVGILADADPSEITLTLVAADPQGALTLNGDGTVDVAPGTPAGTYTLQYNICEVLNPTNCDDATVTVDVVAAAIVDQDDDFSATPVNSFDGDPNVGNVLDNNGAGADTLNGDPAEISEVDITIITPAVSIGGAPVPEVDPITGIVSVPPGTPAGSYTIIYNICEELNPGNCSDNATVSIEVASPAILAQDDDFSLGGTAKVNGVEGDPLVGNILTSNTGNGVDTLNGNQALTGDVTINLTATPITYDDGTGPVTATGTIPIVDTATGNVSVPPGTPGGIYVIEYSICDNVNTIAPPTPGNCDTALVTVLVGEVSIIAQDDTIAGGNGLIGNPTVGNILDDNDDGYDTLNGLATDVSEVTIDVIPGMMYDDGTGAGPMLATGIIPVINEATGVVSIPANTPAGVYTVSYTICEILNTTAPPTPGNCDTATVTITVDPPVIDAIDNDFTSTVIDGAVGGDTASVLPNDTLNGGTVDETPLGNVILTAGTAPVTTTGGLSMNADGTITVAPDTPEGTYYYPYTICDALNPVTNCDSAVATVQVGATTIVAQLDDFTTNAVNDVNGADGESNVGNVLANNGAGIDTLTGVQATVGTAIGDVFISVVTPATPIAGAPVPVLDPLTGQVSVPAGTPADVYEIEYSICEVLNPTNCDTDFIRVNVVAPLIIANDDSYILPINSVNGLEGAVGVLNVFNDNSDPGINPDTLNGVSILLDADPSEITLTLVTADPQGALTLNGDGTVDVASGTPAGQYTLEYKICEVLNPTNCDNAIVTVDVVAAAIVAEDDDFSANAANDVNSLDGNPNVGNILENNGGGADTLNGVAVNVDAVNITASPATPDVIVVAGPAPYIDETTGTVIVPAGTPAAVYTIAYTICEELNPSNCDPATVTVRVVPSPIDAVNDAIGNVDGYNGNPYVGNVLLDNGNGPDTINGVAALIGEVNITELSAASPINGGNVPVLDPLTGNISVPAGTTGGLYTIEYLICEILNPTNCDNAFVTVDVDEFADLTIEKTVNNLAPNVGDNVIFTITLRNLGLNDATGVNVVDYLPTGYTFVSALPLPSGVLYDEASGSWNVNAIASGGTIFLLLEASVNESGDYRNTAEVTALDQVDPTSIPGNNNPEEDDFDEVTPVPVPITNLVTTKTVDISNPNEGDTVKYTITVVNNGPSVATNVSLTDMLPTGIDYVTPLATGGDVNTYDGGGTGVWSIGTIDIGESATLTIDAKVVALGIFAQTPITNTTTAASGNEVDPTNVGDDLEEDIVVTSTDLVTIKTVSPPTNLDGTYNELETFTYYIEVTNYGPSIATGVSLVDLLPDGVTYVSDNASGIGTVYNSGDGNWNIGDIPAPNPGNTNVVTLEIKATVDALTSGDFINNITTAASGDQTDPNTSGFPDDDLEKVIEISNETDIVITKVVDNATPNTGDTITYTITISNNGSAVVTNLEVEDILPAGVIEGLVTPSAGIWTSPNWLIGTLLVGETETMTIEGYVNAAGTLAQIPITNTTSHTQDQDDSTLPSEDSVDIIVTASDLVTVKTVSDPTPKEGDTIEYTLQVTNNGPSLSTGAVLTDILPAGVTYVSNNGDGDYNHGSGIWTISSSGNNVGVIATINILATVDVGTAGSIITNYTTAAVGDQTDPTTDGDVLEASIEVENFADIVLTKVVDNATPNAGDIVTYTITVVNNGSAEVTGLVVTDALPVGLTYETVTPSDGIWTAPNWNIGTLTQGEEETIVVKAIVGMDQGGMTLVNNVTNTQDQVDSNTTEDDASETIVVTNSELETVKTVSNAMPNEGDTITYTIAVSNNGSSDATNVSLIDNLPVGVTYVSSSTTSGNYNYGSGLWSIGDLNNSNSAILTIIATVDDGTLGKTITNTTSAVIADQTDSDTSNNIGSVSIVPTAFIDLSLTKTVVDDVVAPEVGDMITFEIRVDNEGPTEATGVQVTDLIPSGYDFVNYSSSIGTYNPITGLWDIDFIEIGNTAVLLVDVIVMDNGDYMNCAEVTAANELDVDSTPNNASPDEDDYDCASAPPIQELDLRVEKTVIADNLTPEVGSEVSFEIRLINDGIIEGTEVVVTDVLPTGYTYLNYSSTRGTYDDDDGRWIVGTIVDGETEVLVIDAIVNATGEYLNCATITEMHQVDPDLSNNTSCIATTPIKIVDLELTKEVALADGFEGPMSTTGVLQPFAESNVDFTITLTNNGPSDATGVKVEDMLPNGYNYVSSSTSIGSYNDGSGIWNVGSIVNGASETLIITAYVNPVGDWLNIAELIDVNEIDLDSSPNNGDIFEDDMDQVATDPIIPLTIPEGFSPNGDGINELFEIEFLEVLYPNFAMEIVDRYGNLVYNYKHNGDPYNTPDWWNGFSNGKMNFSSEILPAGTYFYTIYFNNDDREPKNGWIYLRK